MTASLGTLSHLAITRLHWLEGWGGAEGVHVEPGAFITLNTMSMDGDRAHYQSVGKVTQPCLGGVLTPQVQSHSLTPNIFKAFLIFLEFLNAPLKSLILGWNLIVSKLLPFCYGRGRNTVFFITFIFLLVIKNQNIGILYLSS